MKNQETDKDTGTTITHNKEHWKHKNKKKENDLQQDLNSLQNRYDKLLNGSMQVMWDLLGGGANDYLVYDKAGYIFAYGCSSKTCTNPPSFSNDITTKEGYDNLKSFLVLAANSNPTARCGSRKADPLLKHFAPTSAAENEALDIIVVAVVLVIGMVLGICLLPKLFAFVGILCGSASSIEANRDRFIQLSTIDDLDDDEFNL